MTSERTRAQQAAAAPGLRRVLGLVEVTASGVGIIMVSSEMPEILGMSDRVLVMGEGQLRGDFVNQGLTQERILAAAINAEPGRQAA